MPGSQQRPTAADVEFMRALEGDFKAQTGLKDRSQFKIFYCPVWRAPIMLLGINPAGDPGTIAPDGVHYRDRRISRAASSIGYCENGENDLVDCAWPENTGLLKLLIPILGSSDAIRRSVVKCNLAFVRLKNTKDKRAIDSSKDQSAPFLRRILDRVLPDLILLTGVKLYDFGNRYCGEVVELAERQEERSVSQTVIFPAHVRLLSGHRCIAVEVAHASQFSWLYERYDVALKVKTLLNECSISAPATSESSELSASPSWKPQQPRVSMWDAPMTPERTRTEAIRGMQAGRVGSEHTKRILRELVCLGMDDDTYKTYLHHKHHSIAAMLAYDVREYRIGSPNLMLHQKLEWIQRVCRKKNMQPGSTDELRELAIETTRKGWTPDTTR